MDISDRIEKIKSLIKEHEYNFYVIRRKIHFQCRDGSTQTGTGSSLARTGKSGNGLLIFCQLQV